MSHELEKRQLARMKLKQTNRVFNREIKIEQQKQTQDENGIHSKQWVPFLSVWASVQNLYGREYFTARQVNAQDTTKFIIRWMPGVEITEDMRILFEGKVYNIDAVDNIQYRNKLIEIKAIEESLKRGDMHGVD